MWGIEGGGGEEVARRWFCRIEEYVRYSVGWEGVRGCFFVVGFVSLFFLVCGSGSRSYFIVLRS